MPSQACGFRELGDHTTVECFGLRLTRQMTSYNRVNGLHVAEDPWLLREILRDEFGLDDGLVISDWSGTYSSSDAIKASLDLEMPGPAYVRGVCVERDIVGGKLRPEEVDECVKRVCPRSVVGRS